MQDDDIKQQMKAALAAAKQNSAGSNDSERMRAALEEAKKQSGSNSFQDAYQRLLSGVQAQGQNPLTIPANIASGTGSLVRHGGNAALQILESMGINPSKFGLPQQISDKNKWLNPEVPQETANSGTAQVAKLLGQVGPLGAAGEIGGATDALAPMAAKTVNPLMQYMKNVFTGAASAPLFSDEPIEKSTKEALKSPANLLLSALGPAAQGYAGVENWLGSMGGKATPEEVKKAMEAAGTTNLPTGEAINSPTLKRLQSFLSFIPGTGMSKAYSEAGQDLNSRTKNLMGNIGISSPTEAADNLNNSIMNKYKEAKEGSRADYANLNDKAKELGQKIELDPYHNTAQKHLDEIKQFSESKPYYKYLKQDDDLMNFLQGAAKKDKEITMGGEKNVPTSYKLATLEDVELNDLIHKSIAENTKKKTGILMDLRNSLRGSIEKSVQGSGNSELSNLWSTAKNNFKNKVVPFENKDILPFALGKANPDTLPTKFIKSGRQANPTQLRKITSLLNPDEKGDLANLYLTGGNDEFNPSQVVSTHARLGKTLQDELFSPEQNKEFRDIKSTAEKLGAEKDQMFIPKTGYTGAAQKTGEYLAKYGGAAAAGLGALGATGHLPPEVLHTLLYGAAGVGVGNLATKALLSDALKKIYINAQLNKGINKMPKNNFLSYPAYQALTGKQ